MNKNKVNYRDPIEFLDKIILLVPENYNDKGYYAHTFKEALISLRKDFFLTPKEMNEFIWTKITKVIINRVEYRTNVNNMKDWKYKILSLLSEKSIDSIKKYYNELTEAKKKN